MLRMMRRFMVVAVMISLMSGGLALAQGIQDKVMDKAMDKAMDKGMDKMMGQPTTPSMPGKADMPSMDKGTMPKAGVGMDKSGMDKAPMGMDKGKGSMDKAGMGMEKAGMDKGKAKAMSGPVDINTADEASLQTVKGIGPAKAKAIVAYRQQHGPFKSVDELDKVPGIGKKTLTSMRDKLTVGKM